MGNSAYIVLKLESNGTLSGGATLRGKVLLDVIQTISADSLIFRFYGHEVTKVKAGSDSDTEETANIYSAEAILHSFDGCSVAPGRYAFPFEVALPRGLPGSQGYNTNWTPESCSISYHCEAKLDRSGVICKWNVENSCVVLLKDEPYASFSTPMFLGPTLSKVSFMMAYSCGVIKFGGKVNTTSVCANEKFRVDYGIRNQSTADVKTLTIVLKCFTSFTARGYCKDVTHTIFEKHIEAVNLVGAEPLHEIRDGAVDHDYGTMLEHINEGEFGVDIPISGDILSSYYGSLMTVRYELLLSMTTAFGTNNETISIPIMIHRRGFNFGGGVPKVETNHTMPVHWTALEMPTTVLNEPSVHLAYGYDTVGSLYVMVKESRKWQEVAVLKDWLSHSPRNINLLMPDTMLPLFRSIKSDTSFYALCQTLGVAMNDISSTNKCTTAHITEAARAVSPSMKSLVCILFAPHCTDRANAPDAFVAVGLTDVEMANVMLHYIEHFEFPIPCAEDSEANSVTQPLLRSIFK
jgi:Arrestin (or S-antigen), N-terminal domain